MYKVIDESCILRVSDCTFIPRVASNIDYQEFLEWVADGNEPDPAEPTTLQVPQVIEASLGGVALIREGLMEVVVGVVNDPDTPAEIRWSWDRAHTWERRSPALLYIAEKAGITEEKMDELFLLASTLSV